jgi:ADP-ribose pyrophosphatase YjhB (NUDIX family)
MLDPAKPSIAVGLIRNHEGKLLLAWNSQWKCFTLPMTKIDQDPPSESAEQAAVRALAEVLGVPARPLAKQAAEFFRSLQLSSRDGEIKDYQFHAVKLEPHPDFAGTAQPTVPTLWADIDQLIANEYHPVSPSVALILSDGLGNNWL